MVTRRKVVIGTGAAAVAAGGAFHMQTRAGRASEQRAICYLKISLQ